jgi:choline dehydrogenase-like flavoprotein
MTGSDAGGTGATPSPERRAIVVGTGFGGAVTACRLAQAGFEVELLERGRRYNLSDFPALPKAGELLPDSRRWTWLGSRGLWDLRNLDGVTVVQAAGYGGGSLAYANVHLRPPPVVFDEGWPVDCRGRSGLDPYFELVAYTLDVKPVPEVWRGSGKTKVMADAFRAATNGAPENVFFPPLAIRYPAPPPATWSEPPPPTPEDKLRLNQYQRPQGECQRCGACDFGCRYGAKNTLDRNYLAKAEATGRVHVRTLIEVTLITSLPGGHRVDYTDHLTNETGKLEAPYLFLCAGAVNTTELLLKSIAKSNLVYPPSPPRPAPPIPQPGERYYFNADAPAMVFDADKPTEPHAGPVITTALAYRNVECAVRSDADAPGRKWFLIEDGGYPTVTEKWFSLFRVPLLMGRNRFDPSPRPTTSLTVIGAPGAKPDPDRYAAFWEGMAAAIREGTLPDVLPPKFKTAIEGLADLAAKLRDDELGELTEAVRDAVFMNSLLFRFLRFLKVDVWAPWLWRAVYRGSLRFMRVRREELLAQTLLVTHKRYGVDDLKTFPHRIGRALMGERYPVNAPDNPFGRALPPVPAPGPSRHALLLAMGRDDLPATLKWDGKRTVVHFVDASFPTLAEEERVMRGIADSLGGTLRASPLWSLARRPLSAHSHGGCTLGKVTDDWGEVRYNPNLFINDGALLPRPVGVNPSATIAAVAERNIARFVRRVLGTDELPWQDELDRARAWTQASLAQGVVFEPPDGERITPMHKLVGFSFAEVMEGHLQAIDDGPYLPQEDDDPSSRRVVDLVPKARFLAAEFAAQKRAQTRVTLNARVADIGSFLNDRKHQIKFSGQLSLEIPGDPPEFVTASTKGFMNLLTDAGPEVRRMTYGLEFERPDGVWTLRGIKEIEDNPGFDAWLDTAVLYVELYDPKKRPRARGVLRLGIKEFLDNQIRGLAAEGTEDPARVIWTLGSFAVFFFGDLQGIYAPEIDRFRALFGSGWRAVPAATLKATPRTARLLRGL